MPEVVFNARALTSSCRKKAGVGGVTGKSGIGREGHDTTAT
ncbi:MAG: hypothetical protein PV344_06835 [Anaplasma sp.]|nr:hypothetical protein [Anaplasma sp.]